MLKGNNEIRNTGDGECRQMVEMAGYRCLDSRCGIDQHGHQTLEHLGIQCGEPSMDRRGDNVAGMEPHSAQCWPDGYIRRGPIEVVMTGNGRTLIGQGDLRGYTEHKVNIAEHLDHRFSLENFVESVCWLNDNVGHENWCYDGMVYHFRNKVDFVSFTLRYLFSE